MIKKKLEENELKKTLSQELRKYGLSLEGDLLMSHHKQIGYFTEWGDRGNFTEGEDSGNVPGIKLGRFYLQIYTGMKEVKKYDWNKIGKQLKEYVGLIEEHRTKQLI